MKVWQYLGTIACTCLVLCQAITSEGAVDVQVMCGSPDPLCPTVMPSERADRVSFIRKGWLMQPMQCNTACIPMQDGLGSSYKTLSNEISWVLSWNKPTFPQNFLHWRNLEIIDEKANGFPLVSKKQSSCSGCWNNYEPCEIALRWKRYQPTPPEEQAECARTVTALCGWMAYKGVILKVLWLTGAVLWASFCSCVAETFYYVEMLCAGLCCLSPVYIRAWPVSQLWKIYS